MFLKVMMDNTSTSLNFSIPTREENLVTTNTTADTGGASHPEVMMDNTSTSLNFSIPTREENLVTTNTTADTGGASHPDPSMYNVSADPDLSFSTGDENLGTGNATAETGGVSHPELSMYNTSADQDSSFPIREENPTTTNTTDPDPSMYNASADPDLSFPIEDKNPGTTNPTTETGGFSHPEMGSMYPTRGEFTVTTSPTPGTGAASHPESSMYNASADPDLSFPAIDEIPGTGNAPAETGGVSHPEMGSMDPTRGEFTVTTSPTPGTGGASHPDPLMYTVSVGPDLSFPTEVKNPVTTNPTTEKGVSHSEMGSMDPTRGEFTVTTSTTPGTGGASHPESSMYNASADPDLSFPTTDEIPGTSNAPAETGGASHPDPLMYTVSVGPDLSFPTEVKNPVTTNPTTEKGVSHSDPSMYNVSADPDLSFSTGEGITVTTHLTEETVEDPHPESENSTELGSLHPTGGEITVTSNTTAGTGGAFHLDLLSCLRDTDCPPLSSCTPGPGPLTCHCHLGLYFHPHLGCVTARTFPARLAISAHHATDGPIRGDGQPETPISREVTELFRDVFGKVRGYLSTSVTSLQPREGHVTIVHSFSMLHEVTEEALREELRVSALRCEEGNGSCVSLLGTDVYQSLSLCDFALCDSTSSDCQSHAGLVACKCRNGYYKFDPSDRSCRACESGFWWTEGQCQRCPLGYGGFNCQEAFLLVVIAESCAVSILLVSLVTVLFYYFRRKKKTKPTFMDSLVLGVSTDQPVLRLPRAQFSWRREWEWTDQPGKNLEDLHQEGTVLNQNSEPSDIQMRTFGSVSRTSVPIFNRGSHNLAFISDD